MNNTIDRPNKVIDATGKYRFSRYGAGRQVRYCVFDVEMFAVGQKAPIASVPQAVKKARAVILTRKFAAKAIAVVNKKIQSGYVPPAHIGHNHTLSGAIREGVGYFFNVGFGTGTKRRPNPNVVYCDIMDVEPEKFALIAEHKLPYRSVEVLSADDPDFSSLALMSTTPPYLQFKNLRVKLGPKAWRTLEKDIKRVKGMASAKFTSLEAESICFNASSSGRLLILSRFGRSDTMAVKKGKKRTKRPKIDFDALSGGRSGKTNTGGSRIARLEKQFSEQKRLLQAVLTRLEGEDEEAAPIVNSAKGKKGKTIKLSAIKSKQAATSKRIKNLERKIELAAFENKAEKVLDIFMQLRADGYDVNPEKQMEKLMLSDRTPLRTAKRMASVIRRQEPKYEVGDSQLDDNGQGDEAIEIDKTDPVIKMFKGESKEVIKCAAVASAEYDESMKFNAPSGLSRKQFVRLEVLRFAEMNGIELNKDYMVDAEKELKQSSGGVVL